MYEYDELVLKCFLNKQKQLFTEPVAENMEEAAAFLEDCLAVVVNSPREVWEYFEEQGVDIEAANEEELLSEQEVFEIGDGRYLIVEG